MVSKFFDYVKLNLQSGKGGTGAVSFRREKRVPKGGPDGGDGGKGGDIVFIAEPQINSFSHLYGKRHFKAQNGLPGTGSRCFGKNGEDVEIRVPMGTVIKTLEGVMIYEFKEPEESFILIKGGIGGKGNYHFRSATNQKPDYAQPGLPGEEVDIILEVKMIADIGLVGFPNAGKSTFLSVLTKARPKIANYPFTTLKPQLGVFEFDNFDTITIADIPGIIEGAHQGEGLGIDFLRHIERTTFLFFMIEAICEDPIYQLQQLQRELKLHSKVLEEKSFAVVISKMDLVAPDQQHSLKTELAALFNEHFETLNIQESPPILYFSSLTRQGIEQVKTVFKEVLEFRKTNT